MKVAELVSLGVVKLPEIHIDGPYGTPAQVE